MALEEELTEGQWDTVAVTEGDVESENDLLMEGDVEAERQSVGDAECDGVAEGQRDTVALTE